MKVVLFCGGLGMRMRAENQTLPKPMMTIGCRPVLFIHDEIGMEVPFDEKNPKGASDAAHRLSAVMVAAMKFYVRDVPVKAEPVLVRRWYKGAKAVYGTGPMEGILLPCKPVTETGADGKKKTHWVADMEKTT